MEENNQAINEQPEAPPAPADINDGDLKSTVEDRQLMSFEIAEDPEPEQKEEQKADSAEDQMERYDKIPRFQELIQEVRSLKEQLSAKEQPVEPTQQAPVNPFDGVDKDAFLDMITEDPEQFISKLRDSITADVRRDFESRQSQQNEEARILQEVTDYAKANPDFDELWESGKIQQFMKDHPGHNALSAHAMMTYPQKLEQELAKARKEAEEAAFKRIKTKQSARVISGGPVKPNRGDNEIPPELQDTKKFGGLTNVLAARLAARRRGEL